ncbi:hypothetical protein J2Z48_001191 [Croceifilum oryzae]|uniref:Aminoglycoside-2''-adenylyltransferase n=1 Tax=Croceifilum oryzae TaxID=1553429 RepID=A0AAJ1TJ97_9BACL|nr:hypothetical protein [Croceifilum oryzae]MDQ0417019.1 hypothetical protein [Croceifilum oryzae]
MIYSPELNLVVEIMKPFRYPWFIAGGWALDLDHGKQTRLHKDVDLCCFRENIHELLNYFSDWNRQVVIPGDHHNVSC